MRTGYIITTMSFGVPWTKHWFLHQFYCQSNFQEFILWTVNPEPCMPGNGENYWLWSIISWRIAPIIVTRINVNNLHYWSIQKASGIPSRIVTLYFFLNVKLSRSMWRCSNKSQINRNNAYKEHVNNWQFAYNAGNDLRLFSEFLPIQGKIPLK